MQPFCTSTTISGVASQLDEVVDRLALNRWTLDIAVPASWFVPRIDEVFSGPLPASLVGCGWWCRLSADTHDCQIS